MTWESNNNPPDLLWLDVISGTKGDAVNGHGGIADPNYQLREQEVQFQESDSLTMLLSKTFSLGDILSVISRKMFQTVHGN